MPAVSYFSLKRKQNTKHLVRDTVYLVDRYQRVKICCLHLYRNNGERGLL